MGYPLALGKILQTSAVSTAHHQSTDVIAFTVFLKCDI